MKNQATVLMVLIALLGIASLLMEDRVSQLETQLTKCQEEMQVLKAKNLWDSVGVVVVNGVPVTVEIDESGQYQVCPIYFE